MNENVKWDSETLERIRLLLGGRDVAPIARQAGIPNSTMGSIMQGAVPRVDTAAKLARTLGATLEWLLTGEQADARKLTSVASAADEVREPAPSQYVAVGDRIRRAQANLEEATQAVAVVPDDSLKQLLLTWLVRYDIPVEEVAMLLDAKADQGGVK